jgi:hypothetical protein
MARIVATAATSGNWNSADEFTFEPLDILQHLFPLADGFVSMERILETLIERPAFVLDSPSQGRTSALACRGA